MGMATMVQRQRGFANLIEEIRIWLVRQMFHLLCQINPKQTSEQPARLMTEPYAQLEEMAKVRVLTRTSQRSAFALITVGDSDDRRYLLQWNANWGMFNLIGGKVDNSRGDSNSFRRAIERELEEELGISCPEECIVRQELAQLQMKQFSRRERIVKNYHFAIFEVDIFPKLSFNHKQSKFFARWLSTGRENVFVTRQEIENLHTRSGRLISATTRSILHEIGELATPLHIS